MSVFIETEASSVASSTKKFKKNTERLFLTWPRCPATLSTCVTTLTERDYRGRKLIAWLVAQEHHKDEGLHLHAVLVFDRSFQFSDCRFFDIIDHDGTRYHCKIETVRCLRSSFEYLMKEDARIGSDGLQEYIDSLPPKKKKGRTSGGRSNLQDGWRRAIEASTREEFYQIIGEVEPRALAIYGNAISTFADSKWPVVRPPFVSEFPTSSFSIPNPVAQWIIDNVNSFLFILASRAISTRT